jgi:hypothetical protein
LFALHGTYLRDRANNIESMHIVIEISIAISTWPSERLIKASLTILTGPRCVLDTAELKFKEYGRRTYLFILASPPGSGPTDEMAFCHHGSGWMQVNGG